MFVLTKNIIKYVCGRIFISSWLWPFGLYQKTHVEIAINYDLFWVSLHLPTKPLDSIKHFFYFRLILRSYAVCLIERESIRKNGRNKALCAKMWSSDFSEFCLFYLECFSISFGLYSFTLPLREWFISLALIT